ncbi:MAG: hypothetical protein HQL86_07895, partial [Magnetococcales bacterium]|nr:hypothetical protein [Magnetococcales bacterium]
VKQYLRDNREMLYSLEDRLRAHFGLSPKRGGGEAGAMAFGAATPKGGGGKGGGRASKPAGRAGADEGGYESDGGDG